VQETFEDIVGGKANFMKVLIDTSAE